MSGLFGGKNASSKTQDTNIGSDVGSVAGGIIGSIFFPGVGTVVGSAAGSELGGLVGSQFGSGGSGRSGVSGLFSGGGGGSSSASSNAGYADTLAQGDVNLGNLEISAASPIYSTALGQYESGAAGQLTDAQKSLVQQNLGTEQTGTMGTYSGLGLGGSTMEGQDLANNVLKSTAESANIANANESLGLSGLSQAQNYYTGAGQDYGNAGSAISTSGQLSQGVTNSINSAVSSLGNKSSSGSGLGSLFSSSATGSGIGSGSGVVDSGVWDISAA